MSITVKQISSRCDLKKFIRFATSLYEGNKFYTPSLEIDELNTFNPKKNPALSHSEFALFLAYDGKKIVGRICAIINHRANEHWNKKRLRFGWFDFVDDLEVSKALLDAAAQWGKERGMTEINGPVGFTDFDHQGLLLEGFDYISPMASLYNYPYYQRHFENYKLEKESDWIEFLVDVPTAVPDKMRRVAEITMKRYNLRIDKVRTPKELQRKYGISYLDVIDLAYQPLYNYSPLTPEQKQYYSDAYFPLLNFDFVTVVVDANDEIVGVGVGMPSISEALQRCKGRLFPFGWIGVLKALKSKHIETFNLLLIAVRPDYQGRGVNSLFFYDQIPYMNKYGIVHCETTSILETNQKNISNFMYFDHKQHKRRRAYIGKI